MKHFFPSGKGIIFELSLTRICRNDHKHPHASEFFQNTSQGMSNIISFKIYVNINFVCPKTRSVLVIKRDLSGNVILPASVKSSEKVWNKPPNKMPAQPHPRPDENVQNGPVQDVNCMTFLPWCSFSIQSYLIFVAPTNQSFFLKFPQTFEFEIEPPQLWS